MEHEKFRKLISFTLKEKNIIKKLKIPPDAFLPLLFSIKFGGNWSFKTDSMKVMAIKDKTTHYDEEGKIGCTLEKVFLFLNPQIINQEGMIYRLEKCGAKEERELVKRPFKIIINAERTIRALLNPMTKKITLRGIEGPLTFTGSTAYGISHEMEHLIGEEIRGKPFWEFEYLLE